MSSAYEDLQKIWDAYQKAQIIDPNKPVVTVNPAVFGNNYVGSWGGSKIQSFPIGARVKYDDNNTTATGTVIGNQPGDNLPIVEWEGPKNIKAWNATPFSVRFLTVVNTEKDIQELVDDVFQVYRKRAMKNV